MNKIVDKELSYRPGGIFFRIQKRLGRFARERQYGDALERELQEEGLSHERKFAVSVEGRKSSFVDFCIEERILVDFKAKPFIEKDDYYQMKRYLEAANKKLGLLVNFRQKHLLPKRVLNSKFSQHSHGFVVSHREQGFSLLELLIYIAVISIVMFVISATFLTLNKGRGAAEARSEVNSQVRFALEKMSQDIRSATAVVTPATAGSSAATLDVTVAGSSVKYCIASGKVYRATDATCDGTGDAQITSDIVSATSLNFKRLENTNTVLSKTVVSIETTLAISYNSASPDWQFSETKKETISLR